ncbi:hypothetical protein PJI16_06040 [Nitrospira sp. MA-1]|nr:hypothetical protein [Nitrospira sp. MA-1]
MVDRFHSSIFSRKQATCFESLLTDESRLALAPRINKAIEPGSQKVLKAFADDLGCDLQSTSAIRIRLSFPTARIIRAGGASVLHF